MNSTSNTFQKLYNKLNAQQKEAVDTISGPVMVVAGPGTGKTQILTLRIANILLRRKVRPEEILALTFTESGVSEMRKRLVEILGTQAYYLSIYTFHAFCNDAIQNNPDIFPEFFEKEVLEELDQIQMLEQVVDRGNFKLLRPFGDNFMYVPHMLRAFSDLKREGVGPKKLRRLAREEQNQLEASEDLYHEKGPHKGKMKGPYKDWAKNIEKNHELARAYALYQKKLLAAGYDYNDMILAVVQKFESDEDFLQKFQERYEYILIDEHQDTNEAQNKVVDLLCLHKKNPNVFVVGDEKQSIFRFQGANLANFIYFHTRFPSAKIITLRDNYRSTQSILDAASSLAKNNSQKLSNIFREATGELFANKNRRKHKVAVHSFDNSEGERWFIADTVKKLLESGAKPKEIAVLYRDNKDASPIEEVLKRSGIPTRIESGEQLLSDNDIKNLIALLQAVAHFGSDEAFANILHINFLHIPPLDSYKLLAPKRKVSLYDTARSPHRMRALGISKPLRVNRLYIKLADWRIFSKNASAPEAFERIADESGYLAHILRSDNYVDLLAKARSLMHFLRRLSSQHANYSLSDFLQHLDIMESRKLFISQKRVLVRAEAVRLMTAHRAKGLEFDYVYIVGVNQGHWGRRRVREMLKPPTLNPCPFGNQSPSILLSAREKEDDERRLFYVALTRARKQVYITYPLSDESGKSFQPSQFIEEIGDENKSTVHEGSLNEVKQAERLKSSFGIVKDKIPKKEERAYLRSVFKERGLSPTALNNYLKCPWQYFYSNLLQMPRAKTKHEMYGTAVHAALKDLFDTINRSGSDSDRLGYLLERFESALAREPISKSEFEESLAKGRESFSAYYNYYKDGWNTNTINELGIKSVFLDEKIKLTGKIDKIELCVQYVRGEIPYIKSAGVGEYEVNVVDYKTGKRKTRNAIEGGTKGSTGNEKRQLVFYKMLLDELRINPSEFDPDGLRGQTPVNFVMVSGEIDFVEPVGRQGDKTGKLYKEKFIILKDDVEELKDQIRQVADEILNFSFWNKRCADAECRYCKLRESVI